MQQSIITFSILFLAIASGYFAVTTPRKHVLHIVVILSFLVVVIGGVLTILHYAGASEVMLVGHIGTALGGGLLVWEAFRNPTGKFLFNHLITGILIVTQFVLATFYAGQFPDFLRLAYYPIVGLAATIVIRKEWIHEGEKNMVIMFLVQGVFVLAVDALRIL